MTPEEYAEWCWNQHTTEERRKRVEGLAEDLFTDLFFYDRKGDDMLPPGTIERMCEEREISAHEIRALVVAALERALSTLPQTSAHTTPQAELLEQVLLREVPHIPAGAFIVVVAASPTGGGRNEYNMAVGSSQPDPERGINAMISMLAHLGYSVMEPITVIDGGPAAEGEA